MVFMNTHLVETLHGTARRHGVEGRQQRHDSTVLNCAMTFSIFLPPTENPPVLFWLSGLTCNDENFTTKAGAQRFAAELGIALVMPDTSPRGDDCKPTIAGYGLMRRRVLSQCDQ